MSCIWPAPWSSRSLSHYSQHRLSQKALVSNFHKKKHCLTRYIVETRVPNTVATRSKRSVQHSSYSLKKAGRSARPGLHADASHLHPTLSAFDMR
ncbi:unnamed protein product [Peronospora belbahrii]|uniref:Uncharacterized protein n=1 Tax=Peronospora belbahrii TaxID=622444 RepID=A0ABN8CRG5_9STRA|nr:unnamed protein product [Peronospora belbahrii]